MHSDPRSNLSFRSILFLISRWIALNFECEFLLDGGLPDIVNQKALMELILRMPDEGQARYKQMVRQLRPFIV